MTVLSDARFLQRSTYMRNDPEKGKWLLLALMEKPTVGKRLWISRKIVTVIVLGLIWHYGLYNLHTVIPENCYWIGFLALGAHMRRKRGSRRIFSRKIWKFNDREKTLIWRYIFRIIQNWVRKFATRRFGQLGDFLKRKNCTTELTIFVQYIYALEETCWEQFKVESGYLLRAIHLANQRRISPRKFKCSLFTQYNSTQEIKMAPFSYFQNSLGLLKQFGAALLSVREVLVNQKSKTKWCRGLIISRT